MIPALLVECNQLFFAGLFPRRPVARLPGMAPPDLMLAIDAQLAHVWMVRAFLKHSDEAQEDDELAEVHRDLYDFMLALGGPLKENKPDEYLRLAGKKLSKLKRASEKFTAIQPLVSTHTNFQMAVASLATAVKEITKLLETEERAA
jgi:cob(I)alamin adenosyltransferase